ncbi:MOSC domain-containing protein [Paenibacillus soyae]|uniref:MOSC domain-containing protein n=1 Tax=Paenibacillus soyae TaxID=2969249 RepID=A0A9X2MN98_9BACL|nr:MOSC domain-containing protein [Paenibacillus soyae]MCR2802848.1 MOSC domain-containing protein [Paenibacillus soyae]
MNRNSTTAMLASLQIGMPRPLQHGSREVTSGIFKTATQEPLRIGRLGIQGDGQGDTIHHGGPDKAVCAYCDGRYPFWREEFGLPFPNGSFGENFTIAGWLEDDLCIGDIITIGSVTLQVSQPRQPCFKLGIRNELPTLPVRAQETGYTGFYFRVLEEGETKAGDVLTVVERNGHAFSIAAANDVMYRAKNDRAAISKLLEVGELAEAWRQQLQSRLDKLKTET